MTAIHPVSAPFNPLRDRLTAPLGRDDLHTALQAIGAERYHNLHPFHRMLHGGKCTRDQVRAWALNRYCYQAAIPRKDAAVLEGLHDRALRRIWIQRIHDHDGLGDDEGGIERWLKLTDALDLDREMVMSMRAALPTSRFATEAYVRYVRDHPGLVAMSSCLTELFAPRIHAERIAGMLEHYDFIDDSVMGYFKKRLTQAPRDVDFALAYVLDHALTTADQQAVIDALIFKTEVLWAQLDALYAAYVAPGHIPPGAWRPESMANAAATEEAAPDTASAPAPAATERATPDCVARLARGVRLSEDKARNQPVLLGPERMLVLDAIAKAVVEALDGRTPLRALSETLARTFSADPAQVMADVAEMLTDLRRRGFVQFVA